MEGKFFIFLLCLPAIGAIVYPLGIFEFHLTSWVGNASWANNANFSNVGAAVVVGAVLGVIASVILGILWHYRYPLFVIVSFGIMVWCYFSHQPLWEEVFLGIGIASGWIGAILFKKYNEENERTYPTTLEKSDMMSDTHSKDAINSVKEKSDRRYGSEYYRQLEKAQREAAKDWADRLNNPKRDD